MGKFVDGFLNMLRINDTDYDSYDDYDDYEEAYEEEAKPRPSRKRTEAKKDYSSRYNSSEEETPAPKRDRERERDREARETREREREAREAQKETYEKRESTRKPKKETSASRMSYSDSFDDDEEETSTVSRFRQPSSRKQSQKVVPMRRSETMEVCVVKPSTVEDAKEITETLLSGKAVVLNLEGLHVDLAQRIIDFSSGSCYAISGNLQKVSSYIFIITPQTVDISGDIPDLISSNNTSSFDASSMI